MQGILRFQSVGPNRLGNQYEPMKVHSAPKPRILPKANGDAGFKVGIDQRGISVVSPTMHNVRLQLPDRENLGSALLGEGSTAYAHLGVLNGTPVVFKRCYQFEGQVIGAPTLAHEAKVLTALSYVDKFQPGRENLPNILCSGLDQNNAPYIALEYRPADSLQSAIEAGSLTLEHVFHLMAGVGESLQLLSQYGIIHQDIKPDNILIDKKTGNAMVIDLGEATSHDGVASVNGKTQLSGCPFIHSPEYNKGVAIPKSDVWSAALLYSACVLPDAVHTEFVENLNRLVGMPHGGDAIEELINFYFGSNGGQSPGMYFTSERIMKMLLIPNTTRRPDAEYMVGIFRDALCELAHKQGRVKSPLIWSL